MRKQMKTRLTKVDLLKRTKNEIESANLIANRLEKIATKKNDNILLTEAKRIRRCADLENLWYGGCLPTLSCRHLYLVF